jgi:hypothetical protein
MDGVDDVMISVVDRGFDHRSDITKSNKIVICFFSAKDAA